MPSSPGLTDVPSALAAVLPEWSDGRYLFGAQAGQVRGTPRLTADVDVLVRLRGDDPSRFKADLGNLFDDLVAAAKGTLGS